MPCDIFRNVSNKPGAIGLMAAAGIGFIGGAMAAALCAALAAMPAMADSAESVPPPVTVSGGTQTVVRYACETGEMRTVTYINGETDHLALVPVDGTGRVFVNVISGSGARYASGQYVWWTKGRDAWLYDGMKGPDAAPVATCHEAED